MAENYKLMTFPLFYMIYFIEYFTNRMKYKMQMSPQANSAFKILGNKNLQNYFKSP